MLQQAQTQAQAPALYSIVTRQPRGPPGSGHDGLELARQNFATRYVAVLHPALEIFVLSPSRSRR